MTEQVNKIDNTRSEKVHTREDDAFFKLLHMIFNLCDLAGFRLEGRITLVHKKTGKIYN